MEKQYRHGKQETKDFKIKCEQNVLDSQNVHRNKDGVYGNGKQKTQQTLRDANDYTK